MPAQNVGVNSTFEQQRQVVNIIADDIFDLSSRFVGLGSDLSVEYAATAGVATVADTATTANYASTAGTAELATLATNATNANYAAVAGMSTGLTAPAYYSIVSAASTYAAVAGIATLATNATSADTATYAFNAGISSYADGAGLSTTSQGLTGTPNVQVGVITGTLFVGDGSELQNVVAAAVTYTDIAGVSTVALGVTVGATYQEVNCVGIITADRLKSGSGVLLSPDNIDALRIYSGSGIVSFRNNIDVPGINNQSGTNIIGFSGTSITVGGNVTAEKYIGDGAGLIGIATLISAGSNITVTTDSSSGIVTVAAAGGGGVGVGTSSISTNDIAVLGLSALNGRVAFANTASFLDDKRLYFGNDEDLEIYHTGPGGAYFKSQYPGGDITIENAQLAPNGGDIFLKPATDHDGITITHQQGVKLYYNDNLKFETVNTGGVLSGILTATTFKGAFSGDGTGLTGVTAVGSGVQINLAGTPVGAASTLDFSSGTSVALGAGIATITAAIAGINTASASGFNEIDAVEIRAGVSSFSDNVTIANEKNIFFGPKGKIYTAANDFYIDEIGTGDLRIRAFNDIKLGNVNAAFDIASFDVAGVSTISYGGISAGPRLETSQIGANVIGILSATGATVGSAVTIADYGIHATGVVTATQFVGGGANLTSLPAANLTGTLPAIDGSNLLNVTASGTGIVVEDDEVNVGSAVTVDFGTGLDVAFSAGVATVTSSGGSLQARTVVSGATTSIPSMGIGHTNIIGFKAYGLMKVGLSTAGWIRLYTDSTSRTNDSGRSVGEDPEVGSGVIAEVVTTGISTQQLISPFTVGGNMDDPVTTKIYASIKNLSDSTQSISANLTILQLEV
jgi:hypothetical protein